MPAFLEGLNRGVAAFHVDGAGNRFLLLRAEHSAEVPGLAPQWAKTVCEKDWASKMLGSSIVQGLPDVWDGLLWVCQSALPGAHARMVVFNADGSRPEACGNALRCVARLLFDESRAMGADSISEPLRIETDAGIRRAWPTPDGRVRVSMGPPEVKARAIELLAAGKSILGTEVSMGNPHFVVQPDTVPDDWIARVGPALAAHEYFAAGTNVEFVFREPGVTRLRVWERGVGETEACGSGACAAAWVLFGEGLDDEERVLTLSGGPLGVSRAGQELVLCGPAMVQALETRGAPQPKLGGSG